MDFWKYYCLRLRVIALGSIVSVLRYDVSDNIDYLWLYSVMKGFAFLKIVL